MATPKHIISAATIVLNDDNEILLIKGPRRGWEMPGGQVEEGESLKEAAIRKRKKNQVLILKLRSFVASFKMLKGVYAIHYF